MPSDAADEKERQEQALMRIGRKLQSIGQLLEQAPSHLTAKGYPTDPAISGNRPLQIDMDEMRQLFDATSPRNIGDLLREYHELLKRGKGAAK